MPDMGANMGNNAGVTLVIAALWRKAGWKYASAGVQSDGSSGPPHGEGASSESAPLYLPFSKRTLKATVQETFT